MNKQRRELGILADGVRIESENLRELGAKKLSRYARDLTNLAEQMAENKELIPGQTPLGFGYHKWTRKHMVKIAAQGNAMCDLVFVNDELLGITHFESRDAGRAPILVARPQESNTKIEYHIASPYRNDAAANLVVASSILPESRPYWRWDIISPKAEQIKAETYARLGMIALNDGSQPIYGNGSWSYGKGAELWAKQPTDDDPVLAVLMEGVNAAVHRIKSEKKRSLD